MSRWAWCHCKGSGKPLVRGRQDRRKQARECDDGSKRRVSVTVSKEGRRGGIEGKEMKRWSKKERGRETQVTRCYSVGLGRLRRGHKP